MCSQIPIASQRRFTCSENSAEFTENIFSLFTLKHIFKLTINIFERVEALERPLPPFELLFIWGGSQIAGYFWKIKTFFQVFDRNVKRRNKKRAVCVYHPYTNRGPNRFTACLVESVDGQVEKFVDDDSHAQLWIDAQIRQVLQNSRLLTFFRKNFSFMIFLLSKI